MSPSISWKPRHFIWLVVLIVVAAFVYGRKIFITEEKPIKDLTEKVSKNKDLTENETVSSDLGVSYINSKIEEKTEGPYPFIIAGKKENRITVTFSKGGQEETVELSGILLSGKQKSDVEAIKYINELLTEQFIRVEAEIIGEKTNYFVFSYVSSSRELLVNVALHLVTKGLVKVTSEEELEGSEYADFLFVENEDAQKNKIGIYSTEDKTDN